MKTKIALSLMLAALLPACTTTTTTKTTTATATADIDAKSAHYADNASATQVAPPAAGPAEDIPSEGPQNVANPAYVPTPLLRTSAASHP